MPFKSLLLLLCFQPYLIHAQTKDFKAGDLLLRLNSKGYVASIYNINKNKEYLYKDTSAPLISIVKNNQKFLPLSLTWINDSNCEIKFEGHPSSVIVKCIATSDYASMEIIQIKNEPEIDALIWGPYPITINKVVGEVVGIVRDDQVAVGLQVLNIKTLGGDYPNSEGSTWERGIAAYKRNWGSTIQAYSINRNKERKVQAWGGVYKNMPVKAIKEESIIGSKIALFSCDASATLNIIEKIELGEGLPHPTIDGVWYKKSKYFGSSYMISNFGEHEIDEMIQYTKRAGLFSLYHEGPFQSWGHFVLDSNQFPNGRLSLKNMARKAHQSDIKLGVHTLTNFINTNDPYVTPVPDSRLSKTGSSLLMKAIDENANEIEVESPEYFADSASNFLHTICIGKELIRYKNVTNVKPYMITGIERGAFGTFRSSHSKGDIVGKLFDHPYNVFFPDYDLQKEIAGNLSALLNETDVDHIDFDGYEGGLATGEGDFGVETFAKEVYDKMKHPLINGTSISKTFYWHIGSYYNWGEPWYGGFKESMQQYRIDNQGLFDRNYMPHMMGWYLLTENTTLSEMEWMLARASGYNAGFAMVARPSALRKNNATNTLLDAIKDWEDARTKNAFTEDIKNRLKDPKNEFHLEKKSDRKWNLVCFTKSEEFKIQKNSDTISIKNNWYPGIPFVYIKSNSDSVVIKEITIHLGKKEVININSELLPGQSIMNDGNSTLLKYDVNGRLIERIKLPNSIPEISESNLKLAIYFNTSGNVKPSVDLQLKGIGEVIPIQSN